jgi:hypothetical protein
VAHIRGLSGPYVVSNGGAGAEQMEHDASASGAGLVGDGRLSHRWDLPHLARA